MFRKLILTAVVATAALSGLALTPAGADASQLTAFFHGRRYEVLVRCGPGWEVRGTYHDRCDADRAAHHLRHQGFHVQVRAC